MPGPVSSTQSLNASASSAQLTRTSPPAGVCSRQFLSTFSSASAVQERSPSKPAPAGASTTSRTSARSKATASGSAARATSSAPSTRARTKLTTPASMRASLSRLATSHSTRSSSRSIVRSRATSVSCAPAATRSRRKSEVMRASEVSGVLSWWDMSARASARAFLSCSRSSLARVSRLRILSSSEARMASSPSRMRSKLTSREPWRMSSTCAARRASAR